MHWPRRYVRYAPELEEQPVGTILSFPDSNVTAVKKQKGWMMYGPFTHGPYPQAADIRSMARNLPAVIARRGRRRWWFT